MVTTWTFAKTKAGYGNMWRAAKIKGGADLAGASKYARLIMANEARYRGVSALTRVPWYFIGALHMRESGCDFRGVLHNGEHIIGTGKKTRLEPKGRGPFDGWEAAAEDALKLKSLHLIDDWTVERMAYESERFNGLGYTGKGVNSPYLWAGSTLEQNGKYVADHVWDKNFDDPQIGTMTVLKRLCQLRPDIDAALNGKFISPPPDIPAHDEQPTKPVIKSKTFWAQIGSVLAAIGGAFTDWKVVAVLAVVALAVFVVLERKGKIDIGGWFK